MCLTGFKHTIVLLGVGIHLYARVQFREKTSSNLRWNEMIRPIYKLRSSCAVLAF